MFSHELGKQTKDFLLQKLASKNIPHYLSRRCYTTKTNKIFTQKVLSFILADDNIDETNLRFDSSAEESNEQESIFLGISQKKYKKVTRRTNFNQISLPRI